MQKVIQMRNYEKNNKLKFVSFKPKIMEWNVAIKTPAG